MAVADIDGRVDDLLIETRKKREVEHLMRQGVSAPARGRLSADASDRKLLARCAGLQSEPCQRLGACPTRYWRLVYRGASLYKMASGAACVALAPRC